MAFCPYCVGEIKREDLRPFFDTQIDDNGIGFLSSDDSEESSSVLTILRAVFQEHSRNDGPYKRYWKERFSYDASGANGVVFNISALLSSSIEQNGGKYELYPFTIDVRDKQFPVVRKSGIDELRPSGMVCPHCENFLPIDYLEHGKDCYNIILSGSSQVGKSVFALALLQNSFINLTGSGRMIGCKLRVFRSPGNCGEYAGKFFDHDLHRFQTYGILPDQTNAPLPPLFLEMEWTKGSRTYSHTLCLIDSEGERWINERKVNEVAPFLSACDGVIYCAEPSQGKYPKRTESESSRSSADISAGVPDEDEDVKPMIYGASFEKDEKEAFAGSAEKVYDSFFSVRKNGVVDVENMVCAFVLTKLDRYLCAPRYAKLIEPEKIPYWSLLSSDSSSSRKRDVLYDTTAAPYKTIAAYRLFREYFKELPTASNCAFGKSRWFGVSAFYGDAENGSIEIPKKKNKGEKHETERVVCSFISREQRERTINIHEPIIWMLSELIKKKHPFDVI